MPLPIIVMPERHWDPLAKEALAKTLPSLVSQGYDMLCFESPSDENEEELISTVKSTITFSQDRYAEANELLQRRGIVTPNLSEMNYSDLEQLLLHFVSSRHSKEMALWFKELPGHMQKLKMIELAKSLNMTIQGVDLVKAELEPLRGMEAQTNLQKKLAAIDLLDAKRIMSFKEHLLTLQQKGHGVIFVVGQIHYERLAHAFSKEYCLSDVIFVHPYSPKCLDTSHDDRPLTAIVDNAQLTLIEQILEQSSDMDAFTISLTQTVQSKIDGYKQIEPTTISNMLSKKTGLFFNAYARSSMHVDAYHPITAEEDISSTTRDLDAQGIHGHFTFFKGVHSYCIPCLNSTEISNAIHQIGRGDIA